MDSILPSRLHCLSAEVESYILGGIHGTLWIQRGIHLTKVALISGQAIVVIMQKLYHIVVCEQACVLSVGVLFRHHHISLALLVAELAENSIVYCV